MPGTVPWTRMLTSAVLTAAALACTLALLRHGGIFPVQAWSGRLDAVSLALAACSSLPLLVSHRFPLGVFVCTSAAAVALASLGYPADVIIGPALALYVLTASRGSDGKSRAAGRLLALHHDRGRDNVAQTASHAAVLFAALLLAAGLARHGFPAAVLLHSGLAWGAAWFAGERTRLRREQIAALHARAQRAEHEADMQRQLAVAEERARIARDLHDSAGHAINVILVRAGAARLRHTQDPARSLTALHDIEELARHTAEQIDQIVGSLRTRDGGDASATPPGLASLGTLIAQHTAAGLAIEAETTGTPPVPGSPADLGIYRILQEAFANAARHGTGVAYLKILFRQSETTVMLTNPVRVDSFPRRGGGHGLIGMRERVTLLGGELETTAADSTFTVRATIPAIGPGSCQAS